MTSVASQFVREIVRFNPKSNVKHAFTIVWSHGLGDSSDGFAFMRDYVLPQLPLPTRLVLPNAPMRPVTINGGARMRAWYDILELSKVRGHKEDEKGIGESHELLSALIDEEVAAVGGDARRVLLGGFSQGAAMSLFTGLQYNARLAGIAALSGYGIIFDKTWPEKASPYAASTRVFAYHGALDEMVSIDAARETYRRLNETVMDEAHAIAMIEEPMMAHEVSEQELRALIQFIAACQERVGEGECGEKSAL